ncbi:MAG: ATP-dependent DNA ligase [Actinobacteria bacterium]|nr:ATP-dependent DNA ligase [Actinomycetota bacterium]
MDLPVMPPVAPMLAKLVRELPRAPGMAYEPKWDGFRCVVFRDGDEIELGSRNERPLTRYFPELVDPLRASLPGRCVVDGEIVIAGDEGLDFDALLQRIHPADSRIRLLADHTPASFVAFDVLAVGDTDVRAQPFTERRTRLEEVLVSAATPIHLTPVTTDADVAGDWFARFEGAGLDGVMAKGPDLAYVEGKRLMLKVKHERTADCVVAGFRTHKDGDGVGSLLLGLYDDDAVLHHVGVATSFNASQRRALVDDLAPLREGALEGHPWQGWAEADVASGGGAKGQRMPGAQSRWNAGKNTSWEPLRIERVAEVSYDNLQGDRFRHATHLVRWRPDRDPASCTYAQLDRPVPEVLGQVFGAS